MAKTALKQGSDRSISEADDASRPAAKSPASVQSENEAVNQHVDRLSLVTENAISTVQTAQVADPIIAAINDLRQGISAYGETSYAKTGRGSEAKAIAKTYGPPLERILSWNAPATTVDGAIAALRMAKDELQQYATSDVVPNMVAAALAFCERQAGNRIEALSSSDPLLTLVQEYGEARAVMNAVPEGDPRERPFWDTYKKLCEAPSVPTTLAGAVAGIQLVRDEDRDCGWQPELTENVLSAVLEYFERNSLACRSPIVQLFQEWDGIQKRMQQVDESLTPEQDDAETTRLSDECSDLEKRMMALPAQSALDVVAKFVAFSGNGDFVVSDASLLTEAASLLKSPASADAVLPAVTAISSTLAKVYRTGAEDIDTLLTELVDQFNEDAKAIDPTIKGAWVGRDMMMDGRDSVLQSIYFERDHAPFVRRGRVETDVEKLFAQWLAVTNGPQDPAEDDNWVESQYVRFQDAIIAAEPTSARDLAIQFYVDSDQGGSKNSERFKELIKRLVNA